MLPYALVLSGQEISFAIYHQAFFSPLFTRERVYSMVRCAVVVYSGGMWMGVYGSCWYVSKDAWLCLFHSIASGM